MACSGGKADAVKKMLLDNKNDDIANARTKDGETCLHLAGIYGSVPVTKLLLEHGANPNVRTTLKQGLRMHPLSWNVYAGHSDVVDVLLEAGADVNADFDLSDSSDERVTVLDIVEKIIGGMGDSVSESSRRFGKTRDLLLAKGAKHFVDL
eukprot:CAMPEP_0172517594 /NCGR_PEP_ID=MMETSP1066-20121228/286342_1 /TAXON_ID=671091 /ORGANISM="Coscinodiscus wailesii, Strain CCMP2513" /LENGTH=150 /DNA_ID=CAMNT_0013299675 /DNA_START=239 /DNA_END=691 /DNA_ORIENTATION=+